ncbi:LuxR C-terminal-related transcriptional regulator [Micromonospora sp. NPDC048986]|uniref:LuxR C-terminal-related transcriptional regulator n=1 Tax=Micromonospora sp. NPDC048986 TaxID=3155644 RepID=UPI0033EE4B5B
MSLGGARSALLDNCPTSLSERQRSMLLHLARGLSDRSVANRMAISERTLQRELKELMSAWGVSSRLQLGVQIALRGLHS